MTLHSSLADLFNPSILIILGILLVVISLIIYYIQGIVRDEKEQNNHKFESMVSIISSLAEQVNETKRLLVILQSNSSKGGGGELSQKPIETIHLFDSHLNEIQRQKQNDFLIAVSDDEESDNDVDSQDDSESDVSAEDADADVDAEDSEDDDAHVFDLQETESINDINYDIYHNNQDNELKILKLNFNSGKFDNNIANDFIDIDNNEDNNDSNEDTGNINNDCENDLSEEYIKEKFFPTNSQVLEIASSELKNITIHLNEDKDNKVTKTDYKKLDVSSLRQIVIDKGIAPIGENIQKLKKADLLKLLIE